MNIFNKLENRKAVQSQSLRQQYYQLLASIPDATKASDKDAEKLESLMDQLGVSVAQSQKDHQTIHAAIEHWSVAKDLKSLEAKADAAYAKHQKALAEHMVRYKESEAKVKELNLAAGMASNERDNAASLNHGLEQLRKSNPDIYAIVTK